MDLDLNSLLKGWDHTPGQVNVRKITGLDGREKLQLRIDLGLIQMEMDGRPDGETPFGHESLLAYHQHLAEQAEDDGQDYILNPDDCSDLQQEGVQYYHRYISLFQLKDFDGVIRDTERNLDLFDFVADHTDSDEVAMAFEQFRPYVIMMNTRARASLAIADDRFEDAEELVREGRDWIIEHYEHLQGEGTGEKSPEVQFLDSWIAEELLEQPVDEKQKMEREMEQAIESEAYERAAELRDAIRALVEQENG